MAPSSVSPMSVVLLAASMVMTVIAGKQEFDRELVKDRLREVVFAGFVQFTAQTEPEDVAALHGEEVGTG